MKRYLVRWLFALGSMLQNVALGWDKEFLPWQPETVGSIQAEQEKFGVHPGDEIHQRHLANVMAAEGDH